MSLRLKTAILLLVSSLSWNSFHIIKTEKRTFACQEIIISGGVKSFLDGYYLVERCPMTAVFGQASAFLKHAMDYESLRKYVELQVSGYKIASKLLSVKED